MLFFIVSSNFCAMTESKVLKGQGDRSRIDINDPYDVGYVQLQFPWLTRNQIKEVIREHGPDRDAVEAVLQRLGDATPEEV